MNQTTVSVAVADTTKNRVNLFIGNVKRFHCTDVSIVAGVMEVRDRSTLNVVARLRVLSEQNEGYEIEDVDGISKLMRLDGACGCNCK